MTWYGLLVILLVLKCGASQILLFGSCFEVPTVKLFELERFLGTWFELERFPVWYEDNDRCAYKTIRACGRNVQIEHVFIRNNIQYVIPINTTYAPGDEAVFDIKQSNVDHIGIPLQVVNTDYTNYAIIYGCKNHPSMNIKYVSAWILGRNTSIPEDISEQAYEEFNNIPSISTAHLEAVDHSEASCRHDWTAHIAVDTDDDDNDSDEE